MAAVAKTEAARIAQSAAAGSPAQRTATAAAKSQASTADSHARRIVEIRKTIAALDKFDHAASQLHHNTRLVYRVLAKNDQRQLVLVDTEADRTAHVP